MKAEPVEGRRGSLQQASERPSSSRQTAAAEERPAARPSSGTDRTATGAAPAKVGTQQMAIDQMLLTLKQQVLLFGCLVLDTAAEKGRLASDLQLFC